MRRFIALWYVVSMKRVFDLTASLTVLFLLSPLFLLLAILIAIKMGRPVIFSQQRPGLNGNIFSIYKFRSMKEIFDANGEPLPNAERLTSIGRFIRKTSLDELPGLWNVIRGDMSLVGPRPLKVEYLELYSKDQARRHNVRPGITGWAQVNGRNSLNWQERFKLDLWYVDNQSFFLDLKILLLTFMKVLTSKDIEYQGDEIQARFIGNGDMNEGQ